jgi:hypothetical protein
MEVRGNNRSTFTGLFWDTMVEIPIRPATGTENVAFQRPILWRVTIDRRNARKVADLPFGGSWYVLNPNVCWSGILGLLPRDSTMVQDPRCLFLDWAASYGVLGLGI